MAAPYLLEKYANMRNDFREMKNQGYMSWVIIKKLAAKYYMAPATVEDIVYHNGAYGSNSKKSSKNQLDIFNDKSNEE